MLGLYPPTDVEMQSDEMSLTECFTINNDNMSISQLSEPEYPRNQARLKSLICQLWNLKSFTIDYCAPSERDNYDTDLTFLRDEISIKIAQILCSTKRKLPNDFFRLVQGGKDLGKLSDLDTNKTLFVELKGSLKGGKGGFGSLLRSIKPKAKEDENFEACRDLSGRRLRHVYNE